jgi:hypothetical protein
MATPRSADAPEQLPERPRRSEQEIATRAGIPVVVGGIEKRIPVLPMGPTRAWRERLATAAGEQYGRMRSMSELTSALAMAGDLTEQLLELVLEYDRDATLGGREWLEEHATDGEIYEAWKAIAGHVYPFARDLARAPALLEMLLAAAGQAAEAGASEPSTNSRSPNGA